MGFPDKMTIYVNMVGSHQVDYHERGPEANENRERGDQKQAFVDCPSSKHNRLTSTSQVRPSISWHERQCGEFFTLTPEDTDDDDVVDDGTESDADSQISATARVAPARKKKGAKYIYDADADSWAKIDYNDLKYAVNT